MLGHILVNGAAGTCIGKHRKSHEREGGALLAALFVALHPHANLCIASLVRSRRSEDVWHHSRHAFHTIVVCTAPHIHVRRMPHPDQKLQVLAHLCHFAEQR